VGEDGLVGLLVLILLVWLAVTGVLWSVLKIALGVALGIFLAGVLLWGLIFYLFRRAVRGPRYQSWGRSRNR
jgi:hypothetical protein